MTNNKSPSLKSVIELILKANLTARQIGALLILASHQRLEHHELRSLMKTSGAVTSRAMDRLIIGGYATRTRLPRDERRCHCAPTEKGMALVKQLVSQETL